MNDTTFSGNGKVSYIPVITGANPKPIPIDDQYDYHYCPNCGAKMDKEEE